MTAATRPALDVNNLSKTYNANSRDIFALQNVSFTAQQGDTIALVGPSGSGKSTLLNLIGAMDVPSSGHIHVHGKDIAAFTIRERARYRNEDVGFVFQSFNLIPYLTTLENILLPIDLREISKDERRRFQESAIELINKVGLNDQANQRASQLSGGQAQRAAIARALIGKPTVILADEITANLDSENATAVLNLIRGLARSNGAVLLLATHDEAAQKICERVLYLRDGKSQRSTEALDFLKGKNTIQTDDYKSV